MSTLWIMIVVLAAAPSEGDVSTGAVSSGAVSPGDSIGEVRLVSFRTGLKLRDASRDALRRLAKVGDKEAAGAAREFLVLYRELQADTEMARSRRESLRNKIRGRLMVLSTQIKTRAAVERRLARSKAPGSLKAARDREVLGQFGFSGKTPLGKAAQGAFGGGAWANNDNGEDLVELIQQVISPATWDVNGGPGAIYYWRPGRALVVTAPGEVHDQLGDVLEQLGKMGR